MTDLPCRTLLQTLASLIGGAFALGDRSGYADGGVANSLKAGKRSNPIPPIGHQLSAFTFAEQVTTESDPDIDLVITSARRGEPARIIKGTMELFVPYDDFANTGGVCWTCGNREGTVKFKHSPWTVVVIRCNDGKVHWYRMEMKAYGC
jgi:hypothetical protein